MAEFVKQVASKQWWRQNRSGNSGGNSREIQGAFSSFILVLVRTGRHPKGACLCDLSNLMSEDSDGFWGGGLLWNTEGNLGYLLPEKKAHGYYQLSAEIIQSTLLHSPCYLVSKIHHVLQALFLFSFPWAFLFIERNIFHSLMRTFNTGKNNKPKQTCWVSTFLPMKRLCVLKSWSNSRSVFYLLWPEEPKTVLGIARHLPLRHLVCP